MAAWKYELKSISLARCARGEIPISAWPSNILLSPGQTISTCQRNISQHVSCVWPPCCDVLRHVGCFKFEDGHIWVNNTQHVATWRDRVVKRAQHVSPNNVAICCVDVAIVWPGLYILRSHHVPRVWRIDAFLPTSNLAKTRGCMYVRGRRQRIEPSTIVSRAEKISNR